MLDETLEMAKDGMEKVLDRCQKDLARVRAGRANPSILDELRVDSYGTAMPIQQVSTVTVPDARLLVIKPWDKNLIGAIEKAINASSLGLNPSNDGVVVRVPIPPLSDDRRKGLVKQTKEHGEEARIAIRNVRREANEMLKDAEKEKSISEDDLKRGLEKVQTLTDAFIKKVDELVSKKETEIIDG